MAATEQPRCWNCNNLIDSEYRCVLCNIAVYCSPTCRTADPLHAEYCPKRKQSSPLHSPPAPLVLRPALELLGGGGDSSQTAIPPPPPIPLPNFDDVGTRHGERGRFDMRSENPSKFRLGPIKHGGFSAYPVIGQGLAAKVYSVADRVKHKMAFKVSINPYPNIISPMALMDLRPLCMRPHENVVLPCHATFVTDNETTPTGMVSVYDQANLDLYELVANRADIIITQHVLRSFVRQIMFGIMYTHYNMLVHADVKLENVLVYGTQPSDFTLALCDYGLSMTYTHAITMGPTMVGTTSHMAPELIVPADTHIVTQKIDIWAAACTIYEIVAHRILIIKHDTCAQAYENIKSVFGSPPAAAAKYYPATEIANVMNSNFDRTVAMAIADPVLRDLLSHMFDMNPDTRYTAVQVLSHPYLAVVNPQPAPVYDEGQPQNLADAFIMKQLMERDVVPIPHPRVSGEGARRMIACRYNMAACVGGFRFAKVEDMVPYFGAIALLHDSRAFPRYVEWGDVSVPTIATRAIAAVSIATMMRNSRCAASFDSYRSIVAMPTIPDDMIMFAETYLMFDASYMLQRPTSFDYFSVFARIFKMSPAQVNAGVLVLVVLSLFERWDALPQRSQAILACLYILKTTNRAVTAVADKVFDPRLYPDLLEWIRETVKTHFLATAPNAYTWGIYRNLTLFTPDIESLLR